MLAISPSRQKFRKGAAATEASDCPLTYTAPEAADLFVPFDLDRSGLFAVGRIDVLPYGIQIILLRQSRIGSRTVGSYKPRKIIITLSLRARRNRRQYHRIWISLSFNRPERVFNEHFSRRNKKKIDSNRTVLCASYFGWLSIRRAGLMPDHNVRRRRGFHVTEIWWFFFFFLPSIDFIFL